MADEINTFGPKICKCGHTKDTPYARINGKTYYCCGPCRRANQNEYYKRTRPNRSGSKREIGGHKHGNSGCFAKPAKPPKPAWQPSWAAQSRPEIVAAVRDYRRAMKYLRQAPAQAGTHQD